VHLLEHTLSPHFITAKRRITASLCRGIRNAVLVGLSVHALFDGVQSDQDCGIKLAGWLIFLAIFLHKARRLHHGSVMLASGRSRKMAFYSQWTGHGTWWA